MANVHVLFWFDVEDCTVPQSDDAAGRQAAILTKHNVRGTFKIVGQKARVLEQRVRYTVIDKLQKQDIGFHSNWHGLRPQIAEYLGPLDWNEGVAEFEKREGPGLEDVRRLFGVDPSTYGQPGSNWAPHPFPVLRKWDIPTYVSGFGYVGVDCQPFWYGGVLCTSHMYGKRLSGESQRHLMGLNFELGKPGEIEKHKELFSRSLEQLSSSGGLISILNHPCTLVLEEWFSTNMKSRELTEAGYEHFEEFVEWAISRDNVRTVCARELLDLYPDRALEHSFSRDELREIAACLSDEVNFQRLGDMTLTAAEAFGMVVNCLRSFIHDDKLPSRIACVPVYNPTSRPGEVTRDVTVTWDAFCRSIGTVAACVAQQCVPDRMELAESTVAPGDYLAAAASVLKRLLEDDSPPQKVRIRPVECRFEDYVDEAAAAGAWKGSMMPENFSAPKLLELAKLAAWTLKPAVLGSTVLRHMR